MLLIPYLLAGLLPGEGEGEGRDGRRCLFADADGRRCAGKGCLCGRADGGRWAGRQHDLPTGPNNLWSTLKLAPARLQQRHGEVRRTAMGHLAGWAGSAGVGAGLCGRPVRRASLESAAAARCFGRRGGAKKTAGWTATGWPRQPGQDVYGRFVEATGASVCGCLSGSGGCLAGGVWCVVCGRTTLGLPSWPDVTARPHWPLCRR